MSNFGQRTLTGVVFVGVILLATGFHFLTFLGLLLIINGLCVWEFAGLFRNTEYAPGRIVTLVCGSLFLLAASFGLHLYPIVWPFLFAPFIIELFGKKTNAFQKAAIGVAGILYISLSLALLLILSVKHGYQYEIPSSIFLLVWASDTFAYLAGRAFGRTKLFPSISPKKTWEGFAGGTLGAIGVSIALHYVFGLFSLPVWIGLAAVIAVFGTIGDLVESMLKRSLGLKDSGNILPGHGGILDRFDAFLFAVPFAAAYLYLVT